MTHHATVHRRSLAIHVTALSCALTIAALPTSAPAQAPAAPPDPQGDRLLAAQRWQEQAYGVSLRPPLDAKIAQPTGKDAVAQFNGAARYTITVYIKKSDVDLSNQGKLDKRFISPIEKVASMAFGQVGTAYPTAVVLSQSPMPIAGRSGAVAFFRIPDARRGSWVLGQAFMEIDPKTFAMIQLEVPAAQYEAVKPAFDAMLKSIAVESPEQINARRKALMQKAIAWHASVDAARLQAALVPEQLFRIVDGNATIGWMRITEGVANGWEQPAWRAAQEAKRASKLGKEPADIKLPGVRVDVQARFNFGPRAFDVDSRFFVSNDRTQEIWTAKTTVRPIKPLKNELPRAFQRLKQDKPPSAEISMAETGVRDHESIYISFESPTSVQNFHGTTPGFQEKDPNEARKYLYLSQAELYLLGGLLPRQQPMEMGFYAYSSASRTVTFRTERSTPGAGGLLTVASRLSPDQAEQVSNYDARGRMTHRKLPEGWDVVPTTRAELAAMFNVRLPKE